MQQTVKLRVAIVNNNIYILLNVVWTPHNSALRSFVACISLRLSLKKNSFKEAAS